MLAALRPTATAALRTVARSTPVMRPSPLFVRTLVTKRYTIEHEWISLDDSTSVGTIGITDYAQKALGDVVYVELPQLQTTVTLGDEMGAVESVKAASDIFAPVSGQIEEVNEALGDNPSLLNTSPESEGWLAKIRLSDPGQFETLLSEDAYKVHCEGGAESS